MEKEWAMTGEISLTGKVLKIGGVKEKMLAAKREAITNLIFPVSNREDVEDVHQQYREGLNIVFVEHYMDVLKTIFPKLITKVESNVELEKNSEISS